MSKNTKYEYIYRYLQHKLFINCDIYRVEENIYVMWCLSVDS